MTVLTEMSACIQGWGVLMGRQVPVGLRSVVTCVAPAENSPVFNWVRFILF